MIFVLLFFLVVGAVVTTALLTVNMSKCWDLAESVKEMKDALCPKIKNSL